MELTKRPFFETIRDLGLVALDFLDLSPKGQPYTPIRREVRGSFMVDGVYLEVPRTQYSDPIVLADTVSEGLNSRRMVVGTRPAPLVFRAVPQKGYFIVEDQIGYLSLKVEPAIAPTRVPQSRRNLAINLMKGDQYPLEVRVPIMEKLQDYLAGETVQSIPA